MQTGREAVLRRYPSRPVIGVGGILLDGERVLLVRRGREPLKGVWSIPGGRVELGESLTGAVERELLEEVGLHVRAVEPVEIFERVVRDKEGRVEYHYVLIDYLCDVVGGRLAAGDDAAETRWVRRGELAAFGVTDGLPAVVEKAAAMRGRGPAAR